MKNNRKNRKRIQLKQKFDFINGITSFKIAFFYKIPNDLDIDIDKSQIKNDFDKQFNKTISKYKLNKYKHLFNIIKENERVGEANDDFIRGVKTVLFERYYKSKLSKY